MAADYTVPRAQAVNSAEDASAPASQRRARPWLCTRAFSKDLRKWKSEKQYTAAFITRTRGKQVTATCTRERGDGGVLL